MINCATISLLGLFLRWSISLFPYSGAGKPPMYGDYEAQRHWQEITVNLQITDWYRNSTENDLLYWGLDYPPLTAYHSYLCGLLAQFLNPEYVTLQLSRGYESSDHKLFMRYSVLMVDLLIFLPAAFVVGNCIQTLAGNRKSHISISCFMALILYPGVYLIDYGHFQYNNVSLGFFLWSVAAVLRELDSAATVVFCLALNYKQMELYHALPFFFYYLGKYFKKYNFLKFSFSIAKISFLVILTFLCCWFPFLSSLDNVQQVVKRIFPIGRGLFEDKVASFWCSISVLIKLKNIVSNGTMAMVCLVTTAILLLPSCIHLLCNPKPAVFTYSLINCSFIFFLFSYHVHEKSILLVAVPLCLIYHKEPVIVRWFFTISLVSMLPLLVRDGLLIPSFCLTVLASFLPVDTRELSKYSISSNKICSRFINMSLGVLFMLSLLCVTVPPPARYPDIYPVLISIFVCGLYCLLCIYFHMCQFKEVANGKHFRIIKKLN